jgi:hypothetical protein
LPAKQREPDQGAQLLETVYDYEFKERRTGVYDALREILKSRPFASSQAF